MKPGDLCRIIHPAWREWSDTDICVLLRQTVEKDDGIDICAVCDWWVLWDGRETAWAGTDLELIDG